MNNLKSEDIEIGISGIRMLNETIRRKYHFDMTIYAGTSLKRRLSKVINQNNLKNIESLIKLLEEDTSFFPKLIAQLTVEVTEFFRDPAFWRSLRKDICPVLDKNHQKIKIWIPGCSSGEEVMSAAISLTEAGIYDKCSIIATDLNQEIINDSASKYYPLNKLEISENNCKRFKEDESFDLKKYILMDDHQFRFIESLYRNIRYEVFNPIEETRIKGINMILCRNYFIYFNGQFQERLLEIFTKILSPNGYLAIGNKENISFCNDAAKYNLINESEKIYRKNQYK